MKDKIICILGPTGSGKSELAIEAARRMNGAIISCDSVQVYRGFDIGSGKVTEEEMGGIPHYLIDILLGNESFTAADYVVKVEEALASIREAGKQPFLVGGTGLYYRAFAYRYSFGKKGEDSNYRKELYELWERDSGSVYGLLEEKDPQAALSIHPNHKTRIIRALEVYHMTGKSILVQEENTQGLREDIKAYGLLVDREVLYERINRRVEAMIDKGLVEEVKGLLKAGISEDAPPMGTIGYKEVVAYLKGEVDFWEMKELIKKNSRHYGKRQMTWFRKHPEMAWLSYSTPEEREKSLGKILEE